LLQNKKILEEITQLVSGALGAPELSSLGLSLWDTEFTREGGSYYLRVYVDRTEPPVSIDDCEKVSVYLDPLLDGREDMFPSDGYIFEVSSAGAERKLRRPSDFERFLGSYAEVSLYSPIAGSKSHLGYLKDYNECGVTIISKSGEEYSFEKKNVSGVRLRIDF